MDLISIIGITISSIFCLLFIADCIYGICIKPINRRQSLEVTSVSTQSSQGGPRV